MNRLEDLQKALDKLKIICFAANGDEIEMLDPKDVEKLFSAFVKWQVAKKQALRKLLEEEHDRLAEKLCDEVWKYAKKKNFSCYNMGWARVFSPIIWEHYEKVLDKVFDGEETDKSFVVVPRTEIESSVRKRLEDEAKTFDEIRKIHDALIPKDADLKKWKEFEKLSQLQKWVPLDNLKELLEASGKNCRDCIKKYGKDEQILWYCPEGKTPETCDKAFGKEIEK